VQFNFVHLLIFLRWQTAGAGDGFVDRLALFEQLRHLAPLADDIETPFPRDPFQSGLQAADEHPRRRSGAGVGYAGTDIDGAGMGVYGNGLCAGFKDTNSLCVLQHKSREEDRPSEGTRRNAYTSPAPSPLSPGSPPQMRRLQQAGALPPLRTECAPCS